MYHIEIRESTKNPDCDYLLSIGNSSAILINGKFLDTAPHWKGCRGEETHTTSGFVLDSEQCPKQNQVSAKGIISFYLTGTTLTLCLPKEPVLHHRRYTIP